MKYFKNVNSLESLKTQYKTLAMKHHPDCGGSTEEMQNVNSEFDMLFIVWKYQTIDNKETSNRFKNDFYTSNGWQGSRFNIDMTVKDIAKLVREFCKTVYPNCKFSITVDSREIRVCLMECNYNPFIEGFNGDTDITIYGKSKKLNEKANTMMQIIQDYVNSYNYDNSDAMTDYFDTNFYTHFGIGKWGNTGYKSIKIVEKMERLAGTTEKAEVA